MGKLLTKRKNAGSPALDLFVEVLKDRIPGVEVQKEYRFHSVRKWRFDYAFPSLKVAVEVDGGIWTGGRHNMPVGYINDMEKLNTAASMGWLVLRITTDDRFHIKSLNLIKETVDYRREKYEK